jgi:3-phenylpropionate/trans-cinnamate dioxygenase ferredoxin subunit
MSEWIDVASKGEIGANECVVVDVGTTAVAVFNVDGEFLAIEDEYPHEAYPLSEGEVDGNVITCALPDAQFWLRNAEVLTGPAGRPQRSR